MRKKTELTQTLPSLWQTLRFFWPEVRKHRALIAGSMLALFAEIAFRLLEPWPLKFVFDHVISLRHAAKAGLPTAFKGLNSTQLLSLAVVGLIGITALRALAAFWNTVGMAKLGNRVLSEVRTRLFRQLQYLSLSFHSKAKTGDLVVRVIGDVSMLQDVVVTAVLPMVAKTLVLCGMVGLMFWLNWKLTLAALAVFPFFWLRTASLGRQIQEVARKQRKREGAMAGMAAETLGGIRTIQALSLEGMFDDAFNRQSARSLKQEVKAKRLAASLERSVDVVAALGSALVLWFGTRLILREELTAGQLLVFLAYLRNTFRPVQDFAKYTGRMGKASAAGERVLELLQRVPEVHDLPNAAPAPAFLGNLVFEKVSFAYEEAQPVLHEVSLEVHPGETLALVGPSGSGKSTLASLLLRLYDPQHGRVLVDGRNIREFTLESLRSQMSVVLQDNLLFAITIRENIACGALVSLDEIQAAARLANAHDFISRLPEGYETILSEKGVTLSHGQRQRLAIARALVRQTPVLILDEPTTGLDNENEQQVMNALDNLRRSRTTLLITHLLHQARSADRIFYLEQGRLLEQGTHESLIQANGRYATLYRLQTAARENLVTFPGNELSRPVPPLDSLAGNNRPL